MPPSRGSEPEDEVQEEMELRAKEPQMTLRGVLAGTVIGLVVLVSNMYFGLQTGWISMMTLPSSLIAYGVFRALNPVLRSEFTPTENVFVQSLAVAIGSGPLAFGLVGVIPAVEKFTTSEEGGGMVLPVWKLALWSFGLAFFGVFFAVPLRRQVIIREKLRFPSGSATATMISLLYSRPLLGQTVAVRRHVGADAGWSRKMLIMGFAFLASAAYTLIAFFAPILRDLPVFGQRLANQYLWTINPSPAYVGQGMIMGLPTVSSMLFGAFLGWAILGPMSSAKGWAPGPVDDWKTGSQGFILWISLAIMLADSIVSLAMVAFRSASTLVHYRRLNDESEEEEEEIDEHAPPSELVSMRVAVIGIIASSLVCIAAIRVVFPVPIYAIVIAVVLALLLSILGVRALGETDLNPVSGIGKISQLVFAVVARNHPSAVVLNLVAGGVAEAGAQQAGEMMQDLKTGHLVGASPRAQFYAQLLGSLVSCAVSGWVYRIYDHVYHIPSPLFRIPTAAIWVDCARLVNGEGLPPHAQDLCLVFGGIFAIISAIKSGSHARWTRYLPSGIAVGVGLYNVPSFTIARFVGGVVAAMWKGEQVNMIVLASGFILGEGLTSVATLLMTSLS